MAQQIRETMQEGRPCLPSGKVLLVDDDTQDLGYHAALFEAKGLAVFQCRLYETAIRSIKRETFDLVVVDQGSPAFEGRLVLRYLRQWQQFTPCVVVTRDTNTNCYLRALEFGAADYLRKPLSNLDVSRILHNDFRITRSLSMSKRA